MNGCVFIYMFIYSSCVITKLTEGALREIIDALMIIKTPNRTNINQLKKEVAAKHHLKKVPSNAEIIKHLKLDERSKLLHILKRKATRSAVGRWL